MEANFPLIKPTGKRIPLTESWRFFPENRGNEIILTRKFNEFIIGKFQLFDKYAMALISNY